MNIICLVVGGFAYLHLEIFLVVLWLGVVGWFVKKELDKMKEDDDGIL